MSAPGATRADFARSVLFALVLYSVTVVAVIVAPFAAMFGRRTMRTYGTGWIRFHGWCTRAILRIVQRVEGTIPEGPLLYAAKHQSMYETIELVRLIGEPAVLLKQELAKIPLWGWAAKSWGTIPVDRSGSATALRAMLKAADTALGEGRSILIFPEGTRVAPGETPPLRSGFAGLYRHLHVDVVPVAVDSGLLWPRNSFVKRAGTITIRFGTPVPAGLLRRDAEVRVHAAINVLETTPAA